MSKYMYVVMDGAELRGVFEIRSEMIRRINWSDRTVVYRLYEGQTVSEKSPLNDVTAEVREEWQAALNADALDDFIDRLVGPSRYGSTANMLAQDQ